MVALALVPWREFSKRWGVPFEENDEWEAPGPAAYATAHGAESKTWYALQHHFDYPRPGVYVFVSPGSWSPLETLARDRDLSLDLIAPMRT